MRYVFGHYVLDTQRYAPSCVRKPVLVWPEVCWVRSRETRWQHADRFVGHTQPHTAQNARRNRHGI